LAEELRGSGVTVTTLCPGGTKTEFEAMAIRKGSSRPKSGGMEAKKVARIAYRALMRGKRIVVPGMLNKMQVFAIRFLPRALITRLTGMMMSEHKQEP
jgi:short-subunit dehydrogenase